jgi:hypothetical protein
LAKSSLPPEKNLNESHPRQVSRPSNTRGSRFTAKAEGTPSLTLSCDYALNGDENAEAAAVALVKRMKWNCGLVGGTLPSGDRCFVLIPRKRMKIVANRSR